MVKIYGLLIGLAILAASEVSVWLGKKRGVDKKLINSLAVWAVIGGVVGARLYHVIDYWGRYYFLSPIKVLYVWEGGLAIWGAILGGLIGLAVYYLMVLQKSKSKLQLIDLLDIVFVGLPLGQAIGRWGNYFNGELGGKNGEPLFLYESVADLVLFGVLVMMGKKKMRVGLITGFYLLGYGTIRYLLEPLREGGMIWRIGEWPVAQIFALVAMAVGIGVIKIVPLRKKYPKGTKVKRG